VGKIFEPEKKLEEEKPVNNDWVPAPKPRTLKSRPKNTANFFQQEQRLAIKRSPYEDDFSENLNDVSEVSQSSSSRKSMQKYLMQLTKPK